MRSIGTVIRTGAIGGLLILAGCGIVEAVEFRPESAGEETPVSAAWRDLPAMIEAMIAFGTDGDESKRNEILHRALVIEQALLATPEAQANPDRVQVLRTRLVVYAAAYPEDRERHTERLGEALGLLGFETRPASGPVKR